MGIFREDTEEEKIIKNLKKIVNSSGLISRNYLLDLINNAENGDYGKFFELDFFSRAVEKIVREKIDSPDVFIKRLEEAIGFLLPSGNYTENYDATKNLIIQNFIRKDSLIDKGLFSGEFYSLFENNLDYMLIANLLAEKESDSNYIIDYACRISPYCTNENIFKKELIAFISEIDSEYGDKKEYVEEKIKEAKKRVGVYPIDEKTLSLISYEAEKAQGLIDRLENMSVRTSEIEDKIRALGDSKKKEIIELKDNVENEFNRRMEETRSSIVNELDNYIKTLEENLKVQSNTIFNNVLLKAETTLKEIKSEITQMTSFTTEELLKVRTQTEKSIEELKSYVDSDEKIKVLIEEVTERNKERNDAVKSSLEVVPTEKSIVIPGNDRKVIPASPKVIIPKESDRSILIPAFDESIPFDLRMKKILKKKKELENSGVIFHKIVEEVICSILEGDWVYMWGPSGSGKSYIVKQAADLIGIDLISNGKITDKYSVMAYNDPQGNFRATQTFIAANYGKLLFYDEFDNGNTDTQVILNELYSASLDVLEKPNIPRYVTFAEDMVIPMHHDFRMISAGNTTGNGENMHFSSRGKIDESVQERLTPIEVEYDDSVEKKIFGKYVEWRDFFTKFRKACYEYAKREGFEAAPGITTTRDAAAIVRYINDGWKSVDSVIDQKFIQVKQEDYLNFLARKMNEYYNLGGAVMYDPVKESLKNVKAKTLAKRFVFKCQNRK